MHKKIKPLMSIVTVVFNGEKYLEETILSVITQAYDNFEYIIIDGGSTDGTIDIIKKYEDRIDYWVSEADKGIYYAMNKGIEAASGEFIAFINADDWYEKDILKNVKEIINEHENIDFFYGDLNFIKTDGEIRIWKGNRGKKGLSIPHPTVFIRTEILKKTPFNTNFKIVADAELTLRLFHANIKSFYMNEVIANFRDGGVSSNFWKTQKEAFIVSLQYFGFWYTLKSFFKKGVTTAINNTKRWISA